MYPSTSFAARTPVRDDDHLLRCIGTFRSGAAQVLAAEERHRSAIAYAERTRMMRAAGVSSPGIGSLLGSVRMLAGAALVWNGKRLHVHTPIDTAASPAPGA